MKPDPYTRIVLTIIALALVLIACNQYIHPATTANAQGPFVGVQYSNYGGPTFFDSKSGEIYEYFPAGAMQNKGVVRSVGRLTKLGQRLIVEEK